jgi:exodeoxyribonuclease VII small subunit
MTCSQGARRHALTRIGVRVYRARFPSSPDTMTTDENPTAATDQQGLGRLEKSLEELEALVTRLESGELSLEQALGEFERGMRLTRECQTALTEAEQKVEILLKKTESGEPVPLETDANSRSDRAR